MGAEVAPYRSWGSPSPPLWPRWPTTSGACGWGTCCSSPGTGPCAPRCLRPRGRWGETWTWSGPTPWPEVGLNLLATTRAELGSLDRVRLVVKVLGMVHSAPGSGQQPQVINGFSDLMIDVFGEAIGKHARSAVGMAELPMGIPVEIEMILEVE